MNGVTIRPIKKQDIPFLWDMLYESIYTPVEQKCPGRDILEQPAIAKYVEGWGRHGDFGFMRKTNRGNLSAQ